MLSSFDLFETDAESLGAAKLTQRSLEDARELLGVTLDAMPIALLIHTQQGILLSNREASRLLEADSAQLVGQHFLDFVGSEDQAAAAAGFRNAFTENQVHHLECVVVQGGGGRRLVKVALGALPWQGNPVSQVIFRDITDQKHAEASLRQLTITDELTGAYNRRHLLYEASLYVAQYEHSAVPFSIGLIDIDHFKKVNDVHGHAAGDAALRELTRRANAFIPSVRDLNSGMFARIGGEEFVMLMPGIDRRRAAAIAELFRAEVERLPFSSPKVTFPVTTSIGVTTLLPNDRSFDALMARADQALYRAKAAGRNQVVSL